MVWAWFHFTSDTQWLPDGTQFQAGNCHHHWTRAAAYAQHDDAESCPIHPGCPLWEVFFYLLVFSTGWVSQSWSQRHLELVSPAFSFCFLLRETPPRQQQHIQESGRPKTAVNSSMIEVKIPNKAAQIWQLILPKEVMCFHHFFTRPQVRVKPLC